MEADMLRTALEQFEELIVCPITKELLQQAYVDPTTGISATKSALSTWVETKQSSPFSRNIVYVADLIPNRALEKTIEWYKRWKSYSKELGCDKDGSQDKKNSHNDDKKIDPQDVKDGFPCDELKKRYNNIVQAFDVTGIPQEVLYDTKIVMKPSLDITVEGLSYRLFSELSGISKTGFLNENLAYITHRIDNYYGISDEGRFFLAAEGNGFVAVPITTIKEEHTEGILNRFVITLMWPVLKMRLSIHRSLILSVPCIKAHMHNTNSGRLMINGRESSHICPTLFHPCTMMVYAADRVNAIPLSDVLHMYAAYI